MMMTSASSNSKLESESDPAVQVLPEHPDGPGREFAESFETSDAAHNAETDDLDVVKPHLLTLPTEILTLILTYLSTIAPLCITEDQNIYIGNEYHRHCHPKVKRLGWVCAAHVCARLRDIALGMPSLWASAILVEHSASWLSEILRRSKSESLSLSCHEPDEEFDDQDDACNVLSQPCHLSRIKRLTITDLRGWRPFVLTLLTEPAPRLESLSLGPRMSDSEWLHTSSSSKPKVTVLPSTLFQTGSESAIVPPLRSLSLVYCDFLWTSLTKFSALTVLSIIRPCRPPESLYKVQYLSSSESDELPDRRLGNDFDFSSSMTEVVVCLCALPCLESLTLENALPHLDSDEADPDSFPRIPLPHLHSVVIKQLSLQPSSLILDLLDAPKLCKCDLSYWTIARSLGARLRRRCMMLSRFLSGFAAHLPEPIDKLALNFKHDVTPCSDFGDEDITISAFCPTAQNNPCLTITITMTFAPDSRESFPIRHVCTEPILSALPLSHLQELDIADGMSTEHTELFRSVDFTFWRHIYDMCMSVTTVRAEGFAVVPLVSLLATRNMPSWEFTSPPPVPRTPAFPNLKALDLSVLNSDLGVGLGGGVGLCFVNKTPSYDQTYSEKMPIDDIISLYLDFLRDCLASRVGYAPKLENLSMDVMVWATNLDRVGVRRFKETFPFDEKFALVADKVKPLDLFSTKRIRIQRYRY